MSLSFDEPLRPAHGGIESSVLLEWIRSAAAVLGLVIVLLALSMAYEIFDQLRTALAAPEGIEALLVRWQATLQITELQVQVSGTTHDLGRLAAAALLGLGALVLASIALSILGAGGKLIGLAVSERKAAQILLREAIGQQGGQRGKA